ncbi:50S ribosomal protein L18a [Desulfurococcaceae archaeon MEX13E-LK6-19]|nr:50S ribosomal protein L18a [Desulfurococcaceae archaeon MEX13E-LK6-19]
MSLSVKIYRIEGYMLISHDRNPTWQKFVKEVTAVKESDALEKVYSELGSNHKLRRRHIRITSVKEITPDEVTDPAILQILKLTRFVKQ